MPGYYFPSNGSGHQLDQVKISASVSRPWFGLCQAGGRVGHCTLGTNTGRRHTTDASVWIAQIVTGLNCSL